MSRNGFSLIELLIVIVIIGIIVVIATPAFMELKKTSQANMACANLRYLANAEEVFYMRTDHTQYTTLDVLHQNGYLDERFASGTANIAGYSYEADAGSHRFTIWAHPAPGIDNPVFYVDNSFTVKHANGSPVTFN